MEGNTLMPEHKIKTAVMEMIRMGMNPEKIEYFLRSAIDELLIAKEYVQAMEDSKRAP
jgi:hypothetical protein